MDCRPPPDGTKSLRADDAQVDESPGIPGPDVAEEEGGGGMRAKFTSVRSLMFQGAVLATLLLAAGARWKAN